MPPLVTALDPSDWVASVLQDDDGLDERALLESLVREALDVDGLATTAALVGGEDDAGLAVVDAVRERVGREAGEDDRVQGTDTRAGQEGRDGLPGHRHVDRDGVALADAVVLEDVGKPGDLAEELAVANVLVLAGLVGLVDDGSLKGAISVWRG